MAATKTPNRTASDRVDSLDTNTLRRFVSSGIAVAVAYGLEVPREVTCDVAPSDLPDKARELVTLLRAG